MSIRFDGVSFRYSSARTPALDVPELVIEGGGVTWLLGAPGAGCSTLLLVAAGHAPRFTGGTVSGEVQVLGANPQSAAGRAALRGRVAYVTAVPALQLSGVATTVWEEVAFAPANLGWPHPEIAARVRDALDRLGVQHLASRDPRRISGGELQRVVVAAVAVLEPSVWLLDEPATALDSAGRSQLFELMRAEAERGAAVVVATEDADAMAGVADRLLVLQEGRVALDGSPAALLSGDAVWDAGASGTSWAALARAAVASGPVSRLHPPYPLDLESAVARWS